VSVSASADGPGGSGPGKWLAAFGRFWWDFLVGDTPELLVGTVIAVGVVALAVHQGGGRALTVALLPLLVIAMLVASVGLARRSAHRKPPGSDLD
jgi:ABC-type spermidine/putrescine transport system permease subunit I